MADLYFISAGLLAVLLLLILALSAIDYRKRRTLGRKPSVTFLVPCYNDGDSVAKTVESIVACEPGARIVVVDDKSTDGSLAVLQALRKRHPFRLVRNKENRGKSASLNAISRLARTEIILFVDADIILNETAYADMLARLQEERVAAVSAPYRPKNGGFLARLQEAEYNMLSLVQGAHNVHSAVSLWGGCIAVKRQPFEEMGRFSENAITEDMDLAMRLREAGYRIEQTFHPVESHVPSTVRSWYWQKIRWSSGMMQNVIRHFVTLLKSPIMLCFILLFSLLNVVFLATVVSKTLYLNNLFGTFELVGLATMSLLALEAIGLYYGAILFKNLLVALSFSAFSLPYTIPMVEKPSQAYRLLYAIPFALIYMPLFSIVSVIGFVVGVARYRKLKAGERAW